MAVDGSSADVITGKQPSLIAVKSDYQHSCIVAWRGAVGRGAWRGGAWRDGYRYRCCQGRLPAYLSNDQ